MAAERGPGRSICYVDGQPAPLRHAALLNATASHTRRVRRHLPRCRLPPGLPDHRPGAGHGAGSMAARWSDLLRAITAGYEVSCRIGMAVQPSHYKNWHTTGTVGTFGAAAATAVALRLRCDADRPRHRHRGDLRRRAAAGLPLGQHVEAAASRPCGRCRRAGGDRRRGRRDRRARCAARAEGLRRARPARTPANGTKALADLDSRVCITEMTFKNHGCCGHIFAALDAVRDLQRGAWLRRRGCGEDPCRRLWPDQEHLRPPLHQHGAGSPLLRAIHHRRAAGARRRADRRLRAGEPGEPRHPRHHAEGDGGAGPGTGRCLSRQARRQGLGHAG